MHLYLGGKIVKEVNGKKAQFEITSEYPWNETVTIQYTGEDDVDMKLAIRIPGWADTYDLTLGKDGEDRKTQTTENGYAYIEGTWKQGDQVELVIPIQTKIFSADARVREDIGKVAVMRGPVVYCMEEKDNTADLHLYKICPDAPMKETTVVIEGKEFPALTAKGRKQKKVQAESLYQEYKPVEYEDIDITLIPYYAWANRGENEMSVWIRV